MAMENTGEYLALARKYRPKAFTEVVGQEHVLQALSNALKEKRTHHAYLLTGTRGVGKTTIARLLARSLECQEGPTVEPCGQCSACKEILEGKFLDVIEIDGASQTRVEDTRQLLENTHYPPIAGRYKIYIIDEVHMLTTSSFNALLKTLEEPPEYVKFILATTDPQKIPATVLSRCLQLQLRTLTIDEIEQRLQFICEQEGIKAEPSALLSLARAACGSMRDALSLCDQAIMLGGKTLRDQEVRLMLGSATVSFIPDVLAFMTGERKIKDDEHTYLVTFLETLRELAPNYKVLLEDIATALHDIAVYQLLGQTELECFAAEREVVEKYSKMMSPEQVQVAYQIIVNGLSEYPYAPQGRAAFEMTLIRLLAFTPERSVA